MSGINAEAHAVLPDNTLMPRPQKLDRSVSSSSGIRSSDRFQVLVSALGCLYIVN